MLTIYSKDNCQQCLQAIMLCEMKGVEFNVLKLGVDYEKEDILKINPSTRSFPLITKDSEYIGTLQDLKQYLSITQNSI